MTHPAFTSLGVNGIWVGKFNTMGSPDNIIIKPNQSSFLYLGVSMYETLWNFKRNLDSHMMKNTEWGAMAYLTNSKYGRGNTEVWINNYSQTGCTASEKSVGSATSCATPYFNDVALKEGSTTRNMSGIFDTSGMAWKTVMGVLDSLESLGELNISNIPNKYIDKYLGTNVSFKILGDATGETYGWNEDFVVFLQDSSRPFLARGGQYNLGVAAGIFAFHNLPINEANDSFIVLSPTN